MSDLRRAVIKNADMSEEMQQEAVDVATTALSKYGIERDVAAHIKKEFRQEVPPHLALHSRSAHMARNMPPHTAHSSAAMARQAERAQRGRQCGDC